MVLRIRGSSWDARCKKHGESFSGKSWSAVRSLDKKGDFLCCKMADASRKVYLSNRKNGFSKIFRGARRSARILKKRLTSRLKLAKIALCKQNRKALRGRKNG